MGKKFKKHVELYNDVFEALHRNDRLVICSSMPETEIIEFVVEGIEAELLLKQGRVEIGLSEFVELVLEQLHCLPE